jgi:alkylation response protein AidB-like acyl-CoA dehydrogenase
MTTTLESAKKLALEIVAPHASRNDTDARFPTEAVAALGKAGLLGIMVAKEHGGMGLGPREFAEVTRTLAEADASVAMIYVMHVSGTACFAAAPKGADVASTLKEIAAGKHLTTLAFSEKGSRSHFWAPVSKAQMKGGDVALTALKSWVTSAGHADSYVVSTLSHAGKGPTDSTMYAVRKSDAGFRVSTPWDGMGLRANSSAPMELEGASLADNRRLTEEGAGFKTMLEVVLPLFNLGSAAMALGICRASVGATVSHLKGSRFEHLGQSLGETLPTLRAGLAEMQIDTDALAAFLDEVIGSLEKPGDATMLRVLESKALGGETAIRVTSKAMRLCGGAAFSKHTSLDRFFRDAHASAVMAPTADVLREFIGKALLGIPLF